ncbi:ABC transporter permease [Bacillus smithii]|uniref:ABC transporter permease n=1 Tax=Bacillus smithii TaxID=1479 RepID=UPI002E218744|nr:ABC transporter permease [Bacillus smithii]
MLKLFQSEFLKLRKSSIWLLTLVSPVLSALFRLNNSMYDKLDHPWLLTFALMSSVHSLLFLPLLTGVFSAFLCRYEHVGGGWKQLLALPVTRKNVYFVKFFMVLGLLGMTQILFVGAFLLIGILKGFSAPVPWKEIGWSIFSGWIACIPLAALQIFVSAVWTSFAAPLALNVIFTLPNILIVHSAKYGPFYPWAQPFLGMMLHSEDSFGSLNMPFETLFVVILGSFILFFFSGLLYFQRKEF